MRVSTMTLGDSSNRKLLTQTLTMLTQRAFC